jgi:hypothetical protein
VTEVLGGGGRERPVKQRAKNRAGSVYNRPLPPPPPTPHAGPGRSKSGSAGPGLSVTDLSLLHPPRRARLAWMPGPVTTYFLPHPPRRARSAWTPGPVTNRRGALCTGFTLVIVNPLTRIWWMINASQLLFHSFLEFLKLVQIAMVHVLGFVGDEHCFSLHPS